MNLATFSSRVVGIRMPTSILPPRTGTGGERIHLRAESSSSISTSKPGTCRHHRHRHRHRHPHLRPNCAECKYRSSTIIFLASACKKRGIAAITDAPRAGPTRKGALPCGTFALGSRSRCGQACRKIDCDAVLLQVHRVDETARRGYSWMLLAKSPSSAGLDVSGKDPNGRGGRRRRLSVLQGDAARDEKGGAFLGRSEGDTSLRSSSEVEDRSFVEDDSVQLEEENPSLEKSPAPKRQDYNYNGQDSDLLYFGKFAAICFVAAATIKYGSVALPSLAKPNLLSALFMVTVPMGVSAIALVSASADKKGDHQM